ncbi:lysophospholipid acyltransferase family protein [Croceicoccus bisphenolivorans]|uniref:lysophospholipid acyltransferase family protein n=1 Tax=Croceicoccus bisphenolivorans TaxID=1783232 RepID=UPI000B3354A0|nr:1-acyl-sn-glycerol-3-phosphate acyltransferase [Croceicoccus bisphenolivorans]
MIGWLRTIVFMALFYGGSFLLLAFAAAAIALPRPLIFAVARGWSRWHRICCRYILDFRVAVEGEHHPTQALYAIKHESFFEAIDAPTFLGGNVIPFAKIELMRLPLWGKAAYRYGIVGVERESGARAIRHITKSAREAKPEGRDFVIFPEGTRVPHDRTHKLEAGLYAIYKILGLPLVPVAVDSGLLYQPRPMRSGTVTYRIGEALPPGLSREEMEARVFAAINALNKPGAPMVEKD